MLNKYYTISEVSALAGENKETLKKRCQSGDIKGALKVSNLWLIPKEYVHGMKMLRAGVYIDGANLLHGGKEIGWLVDYVKLQAFIKRRYDPMVLSYYDSFGFERDHAGFWKKDHKGELIPSVSQLNFLNFLTGIGYRVVKKPLKFINGNTSKPKNNMDTYITLDIYKEVANWDVLLLFTGDSDFERLLQELLPMGKSIHIFSFSSRLSYELKTLSFSSPAVSFTKLDELEFTLKRE